MEKKLPKIYLIYYNSVVALAHYQISSISFLKEFIDLNISSDMMIKNIKHMKLNISIVAVSLNSNILKMI